MPPGPSLRMGRILQLRGRMRPLQYVDPAKVSSLLHWFRSPFCGLTSVKSKIQFCFPVRTHATLSAETRPAQLFSFQRHFVRHHDGRPVGCRHLRRRGVVLPDESEDEEKEQNRGCGDLQLGVAGEGGGRPRPKLKVKKHLSPLNSNPYSAGGGQEDFGRQGQQRRQQPDGGGGCNYTNLHDCLHEGGGGGRAGRNSADSSSNEEPPPEYSEACKF